MLRIAEKALAQLGLASTWLVGILFVLAYSYIETLNVLAHLDIIAAPVLFGNILLTLSWFVHLVAYDKTTFSGLIRLAYTTIFWFVINGALLLGFLLVYGW